MAKHVIEVSVDVEFVVRLDCKAAQKEALLIEAIEQILDLPREAAAITHNGKYDIQCRNSSLCHMDGAAIPEKAPFKKAYKKHCTPKKARA